MKTSLLTFRQSQGVESKASLFAILHMDLIFICFFCQAQKLSRACFLTPPHTHTHTLQSLLLNTHPPSTHTHTHTHTQKQTQTHTPHTHQHSHALTRSVTPIAVYRFTFRNP